MAPSWWPNAVPAMHCTTSQHGRKTRDAGRLAVNALRICGAIIQRGLFDLTDPQIEADRNYRHMQLLNRSPEMIHGRLIEL
jgi:hypothetical protein